MSTSNSISISKYLNIRISTCSEGKILPTGWLVSGVLVKNCEKMVKNWHGPISAFLGGS